MIAFEVNDMTCGHCVSSITKAVQAIDPQARVEIDLARHLVQIAPVQTDASQLGDAMVQAGYTPVPVAAGAASRGTAAASGGCCGSC